MTSNFHTHCCFCHGAGHPEEYIAQALRKCFSILGFSCHAPTPFKTGWTMSDEKAEEYLETIDELKKKYKNHIQICKGMEIDYLSGDTRNIFRRYNLDYIIGSVHFIMVPTLMSNNEVMRKYYSIDSGLEAFEETLHMCSGSSIEKLVSQYYKAVLEMLQNNRIDILAHFDLVKKNNTGQRFFSEEEKWYVDLVRNVVEKVSKHGVMVEVNTGGIARGYTDETYPSEWIIRECRKRDIPIVLSSDAHIPEDIDFYFEEAREIIKSAGYGETWEFYNGKWISRKL